MGHICSFPSKPSASGGEEDAQVHLNSYFVDAAQIGCEANWDRIPDVNHVTLHSFLQMAKHAGFTVQQLKLIPAGYVYLKPNNSNSK